MKKLEKNENAKNGQFIFTYKYQFSWSQNIINIINIDVYGDVEEITFHSLDNTGTCNVNLKDSKKVFPNIQTLIFNNNISKIEIPNAMFPNVKNVIAEESNIFCNVFYTDENTVIDLAKYQYIGDNAFKGCKTLNVINTENIQFCSKNAFDDSAINDIPFVNGVKTIGTILFDIDEDYPIIKIPEFVTCYSEKIKYLSIQTLIINTASNYEKLRLLSVKSNKIIIQEQAIQSLNYDLLSKSSLRLIRETSEIELQGNNNHLKTFDGIIYDDKMKILLLCPKNKKGEIIIPDGVEMIECHAFDACNEIESIVMPDSLLYLKRFAIYNCENLKHVSFSKKLMRFGSVNGGSAICHCNNLQDFVIPSMVTEIDQFVEPSKCIENIMLPDGVKAINEYSFNGFSGVKSITVPDSVISLGIEAFTGIKSIKSSVYIKNLIISSVYVMNDMNKINLNNFSTYEDFKNYFFTKFEIGNMILFIPNYCLTTLILADIEKLIMTNGLTNDTLNQIYIMCFDYICEKKAEYTASYTRNNQFVHVKYADILKLILYKITNSEYIKKKLKRTAKKMALFFVETELENLFVEFLNLNLISKKTLESLNEVTRERGNVSYQAYIMNKLQTCVNKEQHSFKL